MMSPVQTTPARREKRTDSPQRAWAGPSRATKKEHVSPARKPAADDVYVEAMLVDQFRMFLTEGDNKVHTPRMPPAYKQALLPEPQGQARPGIAFFKMNVEEPEAKENIGRELLSKVRKLLSLLWQRLARHPIRDEEQGHCLLDGMDG